MKKIYLLSLLFLLPSLIFGAAKPSFSSQLEKKVQSLVNAQRVKNGLKPLLYSKKLASIARSHSMDMAKRDYASHYTPEGLDPSARAEKTGFNIIKKKKDFTRKGIGENIYQQQTFVEKEDEKLPYLEKPDVVAKKAVESWMSSPGHRENILNPDYTMAGTGVAIAKDKTIKITQNFF